MARVMVTGGNGFIGAWCVETLLAAGHDVTVTVRSPAKADVVRTAVTAAADPARLTFGVVDLLDDDGWLLAMGGCDAVLHVASPLAGDEDDPESFVRPAVDGTLRVLDAAVGAGVRRVVMTSSCAAATPPSEQRTGTVDETTWTDPDEPDLAAYRRSKVLSERAAWDFVAEHPELELTTVLPASVFGPARSADGTSSLQIIARLLDGSMPALPHLGFEVVDVRDVAAAHLLAMDAPQAAGQRYIVSGELLWLGDVAAILREHLGSDAAKVATEPLDDDVLRAFAASNAELRSVLPLLGRELRHDATKAREQLGWTARPAVETIVASGRSVVELAAAGA
jgi:dihydroflavonol-4-reductase